MSTTDRTVALVSWWVATYSRHLPAEVAERRQGELASDLWEQRAYGRAVGAPAPAVALSIRRRMTAGMPADLRWDNDNSRQHGVGRSGREDNPCCEPWQETGGGCWPAWSAPSRSPSGWPSR